MPEVTGFHTCRLNGSVGFIERNAPFFAQDSPDKPHRAPFLGEGYYLWDDDEPAAHKWGKFLYRGKYYVVEVIVPHSEEEFLDLCSRPVLRKWNEMVTRLEEKGIMARNLPVGKTFEFLRRLHAENPERNIFPFTMVRAMESKPDGTAPRHFRKGFSSYLEQNPVWILCLFTNYNLPSLRKRVVHPL